MSNDARYILEYELQDYSNGFPFDCIKKLNNHPDLVWLTPLKRIDTIGLTFLGETKHVNTDVIVKESKADQILECKECEYWKDVTGDYNDLPS